MLLPLHSSQADSNMATCANRQNQRSRIYYPLFKLSTNKDDVFWQWWNLPWNVTEELIKQSSPVSAAAVPTFIPPGYTRLLPPFLFYVLCFCGSGQRHKFPGCPFVHMPHCRERDISWMPSGNFLKLATNIHITLKLLTFIGQRSKLH